MKDLKVNQKQFGEILGVNPSSVDAARRKGYIVRDADGLYNLKIAENKSYIKDRGIDIKKIKIPSVLPAGRPLPGRKPTGEIKSPSTGNNKSRTELNEENIILKNEKLRLEIARKNKELLPTQLVEDLYITYLERFNTTVERLAGTYIKDIGKDILDKGEVQPIHITRFINHVLEITHNNKLAVQKMFTEYKPD